MEYKKITEEEIRREFNNFFDRINSDETVKPDIEIIEESPNYFHCAIISDSLNLYTGIGGFRLFIEDFSSLDHLKISYNGKILNREEKQKLYEVHGK